MNGEDVCSPSTPPFFFLHIFSPVEQHALYGLFIDPRKTDVMGHYYEWFIYNNICFARNKYRIFAALEFSLSCFYF